ncbi:MAG: acetoin utilization protein AcuC [Mariprofundaceae bacterium]|nr:acetoin utilization protein AcuC [Mariprofundaceae bacterium]
MVSQTSPEQGRKVLVYIGEALAAYGFGDEHPFGPDRMHAFWHEAGARGLEQRVIVMPPCMASQPALLRFHSEAFLLRLQRQSERGEGYLDHGDTPAFKGVYEAAATVAGCSLDAAERLMRGEARRAFVPIAGLHHAGRERAAGFCAVNDCGILIEHLKQTHGLKRIAYVDIDAHHGDGVFYAFEDDPLVCIADIHEDGAHLYPGSGFADETGEGEAKGSKLNLPLRPGADDADFLRVWPLVEAHLESANPEFIIFQCGADSIAGDPITHMRFTPATHAHATEGLCRIADKHCDGRLIALGGGGYNRANLAAAWCAVLEKLLIESC